MPMVVNGCGTWYWGRRRVFVRNGICAHCGAHAPLSSYDTMRFFVLIFVPILPMGKRRIVSKCPACTQHLSIPLKKWERTLRVEADAAINVYTADPTAERAEAALSAAVAHQDPTVLETFADDVERRFADDPTVLAALADASAYYDDRARAKRSWRASLAMRDDPEIAERFAGQLFLWNEPGEAESIAQRFEGDASFDHAWIYLLHAESLLDRGRADDASELMDVLETRAPELHKQKVFAHQRKTAKRMDTGKSYKSAMLHLPEPKPKNEGSLGWIVLPFIPQLIAVMLVLGYMGICQFQGANRELHLLGGIGEAYDITIDGQTVSVPSGGRRVIKIAEGTHTATIADPSLGLADVTFELASPYWKRPFTDPTWVLNPDGVAAVLYESTTYSIDSNASLPSDAYEFRTGKALHEFDSIDYVFVPFPGEIELPSGNPVARSRVGTSQSASTLQIALTLESDHPGSGAAWLEARAPYHTDDADSLQLWVGIAGAEETVGPLRELGRRRPIEIEVHRAYQSAVEQARPDHDIAGEYRALLEERPNDPAAHYLLGRVLLDADEARVHQLAATLGDDEHAALRARGGLAFNALAAGRYQEAFEHIQAAEPLGADGTFSEMELETLAGLGRWEELARASAPDELDDPWLHAAAFTAMGSHDDCAAYIDEVVAEQRGYDPAQAQWIGANLRAHAAVTRGELEGAIAIYAESDDPDDRLTGALLAGDAATARSAYDELGGASSAHAALISYLGLRPFDAGAASAYLFDATESLAQGGAGERLAASWLAGETPLDAQLAEGLAMALDLKRLVTAALVCEFPEAAPLAPLAERLCADPQYPTPIVRRAIASTPGGS